MVSWECQSCKAVNGFGDMECVACGHDGRRPVQQRKAGDYRARTHGENPAYGPMKDEWLRMEGEARQDYVRRISMVCKDLAGQMFGG